MMEAECYAATQVKIYRSTQCHMLEDGAFHGRYVSLKLNEIKFYVYRNNKFHQHLYSSFGY